VIVDADHIAKGYVDAARQLDLVAGLRLNKAIRRRGQSERPNDRMDKTGNRPVSLIAGARPDEKDRHT
jgi:hypothetical protein